MQDPDLRPFQSLLLKELFNNKQYLHKCVFVCLYLCVFIFPISGCQCDVGGSAGMSCGDRNGRCRCRPNVEGPKCNR